MTSREGKIDNVEKIVLRLADDFKSLEEKQLSTFQYVFVMWTIVFLLMI
jgi:hypothetical protein